MKNGSNKGGAGRRAGARAREPAAFRGGAVVPEVPRERATALPGISVILPTLNSSRTLERCLRSIRAQDYPRERVEVVVADGGSLDGTVAVAERFGVEKVVINPARTGESGKAVAIGHAEGELLALIDSDNELPDPGWMRRMAAPFDDPAVFGAEPLQFEWRADDPALNRYFALLGMNDPLCLFLGTYDRECAITGRWTDVPLDIEDRGDWLRLTLTDPGRLPTLGANGCLLRRRVLNDVAWSPYYFDVDVIRNLVGAGHRGYAKVRCAIHHEYAVRLRDFARKQDRRVRDALHYAGAGLRDSPWSAHAMRRGAGAFAVSTATMVPLVVQAVRGALRKPDRAWCYHVPVCAITLWQYARCCGARALGGAARGPASRERWQGGGASGGTASHAAAGTDGIDGNPEGRG